MNEYNTDAEVNGVYEDRDRQEIINELRTAGEGEAQRNYWIDEEFVNDYLNSVPHLDEEQRNGLIEINSTSKWLILHAASLRYVGNEYNGFGQVISGNQEGFQNSHHQHTPRFASYNLVNRQLRRLMKSLSNSVGKDLAENDFRINVVKDSEVRVFQELVLRNKGTEAGCWFLSYPLEFWPARWYDGSGSVICC